MIEDIARPSRGDTDAAAAAGATLNEGSPWGGEGGSDEEKGNPWSQGPRKRGRRVRAPGQPSIEELIRRSRERLGGGMNGGGIGGRPLWGYALIGFAILWLVTTSFHQIDPQERGIVTRFGRYVGTLTPGISMTMPAPVDVVTRVNVDQILSFDVPENGGQNLVLTGDQNIIDLAYSVRWSIRDPELYLFELAQPEDTIREVAESAMREEVSRVTLDQAIGPMRAQIEARVVSRMQTILDRYHVGVTVEGVAIKQADPPQAVNDAFKEVSAAQQQAQAYLNNARAYSEQVEANAQAAASAFDKVYEAYRLAPEVTRKRMYYETMEAVLAKTDKVIVDTPGSPTYLPLPPLKGREPAAERTAPAPVNPPEPAAAGDQP